MKRRVLVVDDHGVVREGLRALLSADPDLEVVGEAADGEEAARLAEALRPDVVVMDVMMPRMNGAQATLQIRASSPDSKIVALSAHDEWPYVRELMRAGASGYVLKRTATTQLLRAIHLVAQGGVFLEPALAIRLAPAVATESAVLAADLTARELQVAALTAMGFTNAETSRELGIGIKTVETHKARVMVKLGFKTRAELVRYAIYRGWLGGLKPEAP